MHLVVSPTTAVSIFLLSPQSQQNACLLHWCLQFYEEKKFNGGQVQWIRWLILFLAKNSRTSIDVWASALSWYQIHAWFFHNSQELLRAPLQGCILYWPYNLVTELHGAPRHCNRRKQLAKPSYMTDLDVLFSSLFFWILPLEWLDLGFNVITIHPWFVTSYDLFEQIWIVGERHQYLLSEELGY